MQYQNKHQTFFCHDVIIEQHCIQITASSDTKLSFILWSRKIKNKWKPKFYTFESCTHGEPACLSSTIKGNKNGKKIFMSLLPLLCIIHGLRETSEDNRMCFEVIFDIVKQCGGMHLSRKRGTITRCKTQVCLICKHL